MEISGLNLSQRQQQVQKPRVQKTLLDPPNWTTKNQPNFIDILWASKLANVGNGCTSRVQQTLVDPPKLPTKIRPNLADFLGGLWGATDAEAGSEKRSWTRPNYDRNINQIYLIFWASKLANVNNRCTSRVRNTLMDPPK